MPYPVGNEIVIDAPAQPVPRLVWNDDCEEPPEVTERINRANMMLEAKRHRREVRSASVRERHKFLTPALCSARAQGFSTRLIAAAYDLPEASVRYLIAKAKQCEVTR